MKNLYFPNFTTLIALHIMFLKIWKKLILLREVDYESSMYYNEGVGAFAYPRYKSLFSGNNSEFNSHEIIHLYTYELFPNMHPKLDEGLAVYLGGALDLKFEDYMPYLIEYITHNNLDLFDYLFEAHDDNVTILKKPIEDLVMAYICSYTEKKIWKKDFL